MREEYAREAVNILREAYDCGPKRKRYNDAIARLEKLDDRYHRGERRAGTEKRRHVLVRLAEKFNAALAHAASLQFDPELARREIDWVEKSCQTHQKSKPLIQSPTDRRKHFEVLAGALHDALANLEKTKRSIQRMGDLRSAWRPHALRHGPIAGVLAGLEALQAAAEDAAGKNRRKRGEHGSPEGKDFPPYVADRLEMVWRNSTGCDPTTTEWKPNREGTTKVNFHQFVCVCLAAFGYDMENREDRVLKLIKAAHKRPMPMPRESVFVRQRPAAQ